MRLVYLALAVVLPVGALGTLTRWHALETRLLGYVYSTKQCIKRFVAMTAGVGLDGVRNPSNAAASAAAADLWRQHYDAATQFKADFKSNPRATANKCRCGIASFISAVKAHNCSNTF
jgi:hypothetical protein